MTSVREVSGGAVLSALYARTTGGSGEVAVRMPWSPSMRDGRTAGRTTSALGVVMVVSVPIALVAAPVGDEARRTRGSTDPPSPRTNAARPASLKVDPQSLFAAHDDTKGDPAWR